MGDAVKNLNEMNSTRICIDAYDHGEIRGRLYNTFIEKPFEFSSVIMMLRAMNELYDSCGYPRAGMKQRYFDGCGRDKKNYIKIVPESDLTHIMTPENSVDVRGSIATFRVRVLFRQNASWQGTVNWLEKNSEENFRSVMELMVMLDELLESLTADKQ